jgi:superfamily II DNA or RNA helicase
MPSQVPNVPEPVTQGLLQRCLPGSFGKGMRYFQDGRVTLLSHDAWRAEGRVRGSGRAPYATSIELVGAGQRASVQGTCSCPVAVDCKHVAALGLAWLAVLRPPRPLDPLVPDPRAPLPAMPVPRGLWDEWSRGWPEERYDEEQREKPEGTVLYLLAVDNEQLQVQPVLVRPLKSGKLGSARTLRLDGDRALERIRGMPTRDRGVLLSIDPRFWSSSGDDRRYPIDDRDDALLDAILATGRAHLDDPDGVALRRGPPRRFVVEWSLLDDGTQELKARAEPAGASVVGARWRWYVDPVSGEIGAADAGELAPYRDALCDMPPLAPEHHADAMRALRKRGLATRIPAPREVRLDAHRATRVQAVLTLVRPAWDQARDELRHGVNAELAFRYDDQTIDADDDREFLRRWRGDAVEVVPREVEFERTAARFLSREGFRASHHFQASGTTVRQASAWSHPRPLAGAAIEAWVRGFSERAQPFGFVVEADDSFPLHLGLELGAPELELADTGNDWFEARLGIVVDGQRLDLMPIVLEAIRVPAATTARGLRVTLPDGRAALIPRERVGTILALIEDLESRDGAMGVSRALLPAVVPPADWRFLPGERARAFLAELEDFRGLEPVAPPASFAAQLRPYQALGLSWLDFLRRFRFGGVLADDMGLGKTVQVLAFLAREHAARRLARPALVVCPTSVAPNWEAEAQRFAPALRTTLLSSGDRSAQLAALAGYDVVVTSYALMLRDIEALAAQSWSVAVFDEAQWLKNSRSQGYRAAQRINALQRLCLTGTPVENHLGELKAQFDLVFPGLLGDDRRFAQRFRQPIEKARDAEATARLRQRLRPFLLRRSKSEVAGDLPPRTHIAHHVELGDAQRDLYETIRVQMEKRVREALAERGLARSQITVLDALLKLRQVCCDPALVALPSARKVKASAKREALLDLLPTLIEDGRAVLLFSQFTTMLDLIETDLVERQQPFLRLDGSTRNRRAPVEAFQRGEAPLLLVSLKAGGVGLNLTRADTVILYDPWWNPATEAQAIDRAHRIGQDKPVFVYELTCAGTVEEKMATLKQRKKAIADAVLAGGESAIGALGSADLLALFSAI